MVVFGERVGGGRKESIRYTWLQPIRITAHDTQIIRAQAHIKEPVRFVQARTTAASANESLLCAARGTSVGQTADML